MGVKDVTGVAIIVEGNNLMVVIPPPVTNDVEDGDAGGDTDDADDGTGIKGVVVIDRTLANMFK